MGSEFGAGIGEILGGDGSNGGERRSRVERVGVAGGLILLIESESPLDVGIFEFGEDDIHVFIIT